MKMVSDSSHYIVKDQMRIQIQTPHEIQRTIQRLSATAVNGLESMLDAKEQLFCFKLKRTASGMVREGISHRYTIFTLLGLHRLEECGGTSPVDITAVVE